jgi:D-alanine transaminase
MVDPDGTITEGTASNAWIVTEGDELLTRHANHTILNGITRLALLQICAENGVNFIERPFTVIEAKSAKEAFLTSTISLVKPVSCIDDTVIGTGRIGPLTEKLLAFYVRHLREQGGNGA